MALQSTEDDLLNLGRDSRIEPGRRRGRLVKLLLHNGQGIGTRERQSAGEHRVEHDTQSIDIAALAGLALEKLGSHICKFWNCVSENLVITWLIRLLSHSDIMLHGRSQGLHKFLEWYDSDQQTSAEPVPLSHWF